ncbi:hypothetical protein LguiA_033719 [Lonicera macranthoides]
MALAYIAVDFSLVARMTNLDARNTIRVCKRPFRVLQSPCFVRKDRSVLGFFRKPDRSCIQADRSWCCGGDLNLGTQGCNTDVLPHISFSHTFRCSTTKKRYRTRE